MSLGHAPANPPHPFEPSGRRVTSDAGRTYELCAVCGRKRIGLSHGRAGDPSNRTARDPFAPSKQRGPSHRPKHEYHREHLALALALDSLLDLPTELVDWRVTLRAQALRASLGGIPRTSGASREGEVSMPDVASRFEPGAATSGTTQSTPPPLPVIGSNGSYDAPDAVLIEHAPPSVKARARALSKGITHKPLRELATRAIVDGWNLKRDGSNHWALTRGTERLTLPGTMGEGRAWQNVKALAKRHGIDVEGL